MSDSSSDIAGLIAEASQMYVEYLFINNSIPHASSQFANCVTISGTALIFYDYALTFSTEVSEVWNSKFSGAQALFLLTRYSYLVVTLLYCANTLSQNPSETVG
ncbi:hypothetical protein BD410DRAFT_649415 [Rickenella mellea]|uniref:DUF6533 domain-containing protein n=1 Tax=Rickenella mellea TaxID=50990 RepID=A0A4Y7PM63_9AGAM|nr:hypothetical protein BD410DRAFT_649415 [Rickenella mellea]